MVHHPSQTRGVPQFRRLGTSQWRPMEAKVLPLLLLEDFLNASPKPALVLSSRVKSLLGDSLKVWYTNRPFLDIIEDDVRDRELAELGAENSDTLTSLLLAKCINPTSSQLSKWIDTVLQNSNAPHRLRTSFQGPVEVPDDGPVRSYRTVIDIEWEATVLQKTYIVLTGKITGKTSYIIGGTESHPRPRPSFTHLPSPTIHDEGLSNAGAHAKSVTPGTSFIGIHAIDK